MATTRIIPMHLNKGKTLAQCLADRTEYGMNPDKTEGGALISAFACEPETAVSEFALSKREYRELTGRVQESDVIAYQVRQSFKPGEVTPEEANRIGYEFAKRFLKGRHAFLVCTHTDKKHIHNHIYWNSTALDCTRKFKNFIGSYRAVRRLSDLICAEHRLSVVENSKTKLVIVGEMLFADSKEEDFARVLIIYNLIGAAICEEYFFRYYLIGDRYFNWIYMLISAIMFLLYHASLPWGDKYRFVDYAKQFGAGIVSAALYSFSRSLIPCIIFHLLCNSSEIFVCLNMLLVKKRDDCEDEIDIDL